MDHHSKIISNEVIKGLYRRIVFDAPPIAASAKPGQFVHVRILPMRERILRRPFSICGADPATGLLTLVYKVVGEGTGVMSGMKSGEHCDILGPLGNSYSVCGEDVSPVIVAGGYGSASTLLLAARSRRPGILLMGARTECDVILAEEYAKLGYDVRIATNDGSCGHKGFVTELLSSAVADAGKDVRVFGCGPSPMLYALGRMCVAEGVACELSLDERMCCGVGACFGCVVKVRSASSPDGWRYSRSCKEGPVYDATEVYYG